jgi:hypothetical protein
MRGIARLGQQVDADDLADGQLAQQLSDHAVAGAEVQRGQPFGLQAGIAQRRAEQLGHDTRRLALQAVGEQSLVEPRNVVDLGIVVEADPLACAVGPFDFTPFLVLVELSMCVLRRQMQRVVHVIERGHVAPCGKRAK